MHRYPAQSFEARRGKRPGSCLLSVSMAGLEFCNHLYYLAIS